MSDIRILHGNALRLLLDLETASVHALITDPPYSSGGMMRSDRTLGVHAKYVTSGSGSKDLVGFSGDNRDARSYGYWASLWLTEALRVVKPGGVCILFADWRQLPTTTDALQAGGWVWRGIVPWAKPNARPQQGRFSAQCEYAVWGTNGPRKLAGDCLPGFFEADPPRSRDHVTQKPLDVMRQLVRIAPEGGLVLDPFAGSGTTAEACQLEGRSCIGFEIEPHFAEVSERRVLEAQQSPGLFGEVAS